MVDCGGGIFHRAGDIVESMDDAIALTDSRLGEVVVRKLNSVRKEECFGDGISDVEAELVV